ncbi:hypothetical protein TNCV_3604071 [Trichonephila clavipes]|nr:hypothetical protein TNCV_3604071 [Trichonephila clavipes]
MVTETGNVKDLPTVLESYHKAVRGLLAIDLVILYHVQMTRTTPELASPSPYFYPTPTGGRIGASARRVLSSTKLEIMTYLQRAHDFDL